MTKTIFAVLDVETSGLKPTDSSLLEIAVKIYDPAFAGLTAAVIDSREYVIRYSPRETGVIMALADPFVLEMHDKNGLWKALPSGHYQSFVDEELTDWLEFTKERIAQTHDLSLDDVEIRSVGNSLRLDLNFIEAYLPKFYNELGYRSIDMSAVEKFLTVFTDHTQFKKEHTDTHRAMHDVDQCIEQIEHAVLFMEEGLGMPMPAKS